MSPTLCRKGRLNASPADTPVHVNIQNLVEEVTQVPASAVLVLQWQLAIGDDEVERFGWASH
jgi:hypothetical protein